MENNMIEVYKLLSIVSSVGIDKVIIEPSEDGTLFRGVDESDSIYLFDTYQHIIENGCAIHSLKDLLRRFNLFSDLNIVSFSFGLDDNEWMKRVHMKSDTTYVSYTFSSKNGLRGLPSLVPQSSIIQMIEFDKTLFDNLSKAFQSMNIKNDSVVTFQGKDGKVLMELDDGVADLYQLELCKNQSSEGNWTARWRGASLKKLLQEALRYEESVKLKVSDKSVGFVDVSDLTFMLAPE